METLTKPNAPPTSTTRTRKKTPKRATSISIDADVYEQASQRADSQKRSFSQFVELVLEQYLRSSPKEPKTPLTQAFPDTQHGFWSQYDAYEAAANLQNMPGEPQT